MNVANSIERAGRTKNDKMSSGNNKENASISSPFRGMGGVSLVEYGPRRLIITLTAIICALLEIVDTTIVNVALNDMKGNLGATTNEIGWVVTAYAIGNVIIIPMTSWLSQQFGRRNYFAASIVIFTVFSFLCGNATSY